MYAADINKFRRRALNEEEKYHGKDAKELFNRPPQDG
jgi:hypothetical protein